MRAALRITALVLTWTLAIATMGYLVPWAIAVQRHRQALAVFALNLLLGWTLVGWVVALTMALTDHPQAE